MCIHRPHKCLETLGIKRGWQIPCSQKHEGLWVTLCMPGIEAGFSGRAANALNLCASLQYPGLIWFYFEEKKHFLQEDIQITSKHIKKHTYIKINKYKIYKYIKFKIYINIFHICVCIYKIHIYEASLVFGKMQIKIMIYLVTPTQDRQQ